MAQVRTYSALVNELNKSVNIAVEKACNRLLSKLQELIDTEYYDAFEPDFYKRTYQFWKSATVEMLSQNVGQIFMDKSKMNYNNFWTGEKQLYEASVGSHGGWTTNETVKHRFWDAFIEYCEESATNILKEELIKQGLNVK